MCRSVLHPCSDPGSALLRVWLSDHQATLAAQRRSELRHHLLRDVDASAVLFVPPLLGSPPGAAGMGSTSTRPSCKLQGFPSIPNSISRFHFFVSPPNAAARHHCRIVARDVFSRSHAEAEPATVHPVHSQFLLLSRGLVWLEQDLLTERCDLLIEWFASDALMSCLTVTANIERRQCTCCVSHKPFQD